MEKALDIFCTENPIRALRMRVLSLIYAMQNLNDVHGRKHFLFLFQYAILMV